MLLGASKEIGVANMRFIDMLTLKVYTVLL